VTAHAAPKADRALLSPFRHRDFRLFWTGLILSGIGSQFTTVAMAWQIYELTNSPLQIGLLGLARGIPQIIVLLVGGVLADAMDRRKLMMWTQTSLFLVSTTLALLTLGGKATPLTLYVTTMLLALFSSPEGPALGQFESGLVAAWLGAELSALTEGLATLAILAVVAAAFPVIRRYQIAR